MLYLFERCKLSLSLIMLASVAIGCHVTPRFETPTMVSSPLLPLTTATMVQEQIPIASATISPTRTPTPTSTKTRIPIADFMWTPIPTLNPEAAISQIKELYVNTIPCELPCWWGIAPGQSTWAQARQILSQLSTEGGPYFKGVIPSYSYSFEVPENFEALNLGFIEATLYVRDEIVVAVSTNTGWVHRNFEFSRTGLLALLGQPDEIWIRYTPPEDEMLIEYEIDLLYKSEGILLNISGEAQKGNGTLLICPQNFQRGAFPPAITMYTTKIADTFDQLREMLFGKHDLAESRYVRLQTVTNGFGESDFFNVYKNENATECFDVHVK